MIALFTFWDLSQVDTGTMKAEHKVWKPEGCILFFKWERKKKDLMLVGIEVESIKKWVGGRNTCYQNILWTFSIKIN